MNSPINGKFKVSQIYKGATHKGLDLIGVDHKEIHSTVSGTVEAARWDIKSGTTGINIKYGMGQYVRIKCDETNNLYYFAHLSKFLVSLGDRVEKGDVIGIEGSTGNATGSHLHYEIRKVVDNTTFLNVSEISGIPNSLGIYEQEEISSELTLDQAKKIVQETAGLADSTMNYLEAYKYGEELLRKLANAMN